MNLTCHKKTALLLLVLLLCLAAAGCGKSGDPAAIETAPAAEPQKEKKPRKPLFKKKNPEETANEAPSSESEDENGINVVTDDTLEQEVKEQRHNLETLRDHLTKREAGLVEREENLDRKASVLDRKEQSIDRKLDAADAKLASAEETRAAVAAREKEVARAAADATAQLQRLAGMTRDEARRTLFDRTEREVRGELGTLVRRLQEEARSSADAAAPT